MSSTLSVSERITLIGALNQIKIPNMWLRDTFFPEAPLPHLTKKIAVDIRRYTRKKAPFINPKSAANQVERLGYQTDDYTPPYFKEKVAIDGSDSDDKAFGSPVLLEGGVSQGDYADQEKARQLEENKRRIMRSVEYMCAILMDGGVLNVVGEGVNYQLDFNMPAAHKITLSGTDLWSDTTNSDPNKDLDDWAELILRASGKNPTDAIMSMNVWNAYKNHPKVLAELDNRRINTAEVQNRRNPVYPSLVFRGTYGNYEIWTYAETYDTDGGVATNLIPDDHLFIGTRGARCSTEYAKIQNPKAKGPFKMFVDEFEIDDPAGKFQVVEAAILPTMVESEAFITADVL